MTKNLSRIGSQMGPKSKGVLECLRKHGRKNRLDLEMMLNLGNLTQTMTRMCEMGYIKRCNLGTHVGMFEITKLGRVALGESLEIEAPREMRICGGTSREIYNPAIHLVSRIGVARV